jgi:hypothetical protein
VVSHQSIYHLSAIELGLLNEEEHSKCDHFSLFIHEFLGNSVSLLADPTPNVIEDYWDMEPYGNDIDNAIAYLEADLTDTAGKPFAQHLLVNALINAKVLLPHDGGTALAHVIK